MGPEHEGSHRRLFVAVWPPPDIVAALGRRVGGGSGRLRWVSPENLHVTLYFIGEADVHQVTRRLDDADLVRSTARLGPAVRRLGASALVVPVTGLDSLAVGVATSLADVAPSSAPVPFSGHLTLGRIRGRPHPDPAAAADLDLIGTPVEGSFAVDDVALMSSELTPDGPLYTTLASWPTFAPGDPAP